MPESCGGAPFRQITLKGGETMSRTRTGYIFLVLVAALAVVFAFSAIDPAHAAERKSIRWATSSTGSYGYKVAAQMVQVLEDALGGEYTVTVNPYPSTTAAMKATMDGDAEIGYTADVGMTDVYAGDGRLQGLQARQVEDGPHLVCVPDGVVHGRVCPEGRPVQILGRLQRQAGVLHPRRLHELAEFPAHLQGAGLRVQACPDRRACPGRRAPGRHRRRRGLLYDRRPVASVLLARDRAAPGYQDHQPERRGSQETHRGEPRPRGDRCGEGIQQGCRREDDPGRAAPVRLQHAVRTCPRRSSTRC